MCVCVGAAGAPLPTEGRYSTMGRASATTVGTMLLQSRLRSSSNPDIPTPHPADDPEVKDILLAKVYTHTDTHILTHTHRCTHTYIVTTTHIDSNTDRDKHMHVHTRTSRDAHTRTHAHTQSYLVDQTVCLIPPPQGHNHPGSRMSTYMDVTSHAQSSTGGTRPSNRKVRPPLQAPSLNQTSVSLSSH